ncbi:MAG: hypothetical protein V2A76_09875 [Planctomycetota bacterium]
MRLIIAGLAFSLFAAPGVFAAEEAGADNAAQAFAKGQELLQQGDFEAALNAYSNAASADEKNAEYRQNYMLVKRMIAMREAIESEQDAEKWASTANALKNFYYKNHLYGELEKIAREMHSRKNTVGSATLLVDALLILERNAEAVEVLAPFSDEEMGDHVKILKGIALGRLKKVDEAKALAGEIDVPEGSSPRFMYDVARLKVLCGDVDGGMATLTTAIESTAPMASASFKDFVKNTPEFAALPADANFEMVLKTKSKVKESACSSGGDCGSCPSKGGCEGEAKP